MESDLRKSGENSLISSPSFSIYRAENGWIVCTRGGSYIEPSIQEVGRRLVALEVEREVNAKRFIEANTPKEVSSATYAGPLVSNGESLQVTHTVSGFFVVGSGKDFVIVSPDCPDYTPCP